MDGFFSQLSYKCYREEVASRGDELKMCPELDSGLGDLRECAKVGDEEDEKLVEGRDERGGDFVDVTRSNVAHLPLSFIINHSCHHSIIIQNYPIEEWAGRVLPRAEHRQGGVAERRDRDERGGDFVDVTRSNVAHLRPLLFKTFSSFCVRCRQDESFVEDEKLIKPRNEGGGDFVDCTRADIAHLPFTYRGPGVNGSRLDLPQLNRLVSGGTYRAKGEWSPVARSSSLFLAALYRLPL